MKIKSLDEKLRVKKALKSASSLFDNKKYTEAIQCLNEANRYCRSHVIEQELISMRLEVYKKLDRKNPLGVWPPEVVDMFTEFDAGKGLPEIHASELTAEILQSAIFTHGSLIVRSLIPDQMVELLNERMDEVCLERKGRKIQFGGSQRKRFRKLDPADSYNMLTMDSPKITFDLIEVFEELGLREFIHDFFGEPPALLGKKCTLRQLKHNHYLSPKGGFHQDGAFLGKDIRSLNLWCALTPCGVDAPGMDIVGRRLERIALTGGEDAAVKWTVGRKEVEKLANGRLFRPEFKAGDAIFFDHMNLHGTAISPSMTKTRRAIETWFIAPSSYEEGIGKFSPDKRFPFIY